MVRLSVLRNHPVVCENRPLGLLQGISLDDQQRRIEALIVSCGFRGKRVVLPQDVRAVAGGFILAQKAQKYKRSLEKPLCTFVRDTTGLLVGHISDYAIDEHALCVTAIELSPGYLPDESKKRLWMFAYARASNDAPEVTIPADLRSERILSREGIDECAYLP